MEIPIHHIDAFVTDGVFTGNPAAVCPLAAWLPDDVMQKIAAENNLAETAFFVGGNGDYSIRWMTPAIEIDLCGHATLAAAHVVFSTLEKGRTEVRFRSASGDLNVRAAKGGLLYLDFPSRPPAACEPRADVAEALGQRPDELWSSRDYLAVFLSDAEVRALAPDMALLKRLDRAVIATAPGGGDVDFVSRFFAPTFGIDEDPVTGSAHCTLVPYWSRRLGKKGLHARQVSPRGGDLRCEDRGERVAIGGKVATYLEGLIRI